MSGYRLELPRTPTSRDMNQEVDMNGSRALWDHSWAMLEKNDGIRLVSEPFKWIVVVHVHTINWMNVAPMFKQFKNV